MAPNRDRQLNQNQPTSPLMLEVLRQGSEAGKDTEKDKEESSLPMFWRVFGGTVLSITAMVVVTAHQSLATGIAEVRTEMTSLNTEMHKDFERMSEAQGNLVRVDECASQLQAIWRNLKELQEDRKELTVVKERCAAVIATQRTVETQRKALADDLQHLREQQVQTEERRALTAELSALRERLASLEAKTEVSKVNQP